MAQNELLKSEYAKGEPLSLNSFEQRAIDEAGDLPHPDSYEYEEKDPNDKTLIYRESRFYQYRFCNTC